MKVHFTVKNVVELVQENKTMYGTRNGYKKKKSLSEEYLADIL